MVLLLNLLSGVAWTIVYIVSIRVGFAQKTYAIPLAALALNIAWESIPAANGLITDRRYRRTSTSPGAWLTW